MYKYVFFIEWRNSKNVNMSSSVEVGCFDIKDNALFLYEARERYRDNEPASVMVIPFSSIRYFTYAENKGDE